jgi:hypothetical protein
MITDATKCYWDKTATFTVKKNTVTQTGGFHLEYGGGVVVFDEALEALDEVTVSGESVAIEQVGGFFNWSINPGQTLQDCTDFESDGWKEQDQTLNDWTASASQYWSVANNLFDSYDDQDELLFVFFLDATVGSELRFAGYGYVVTPIEGANDTLITSNIEFKGSGPITYREEAA